MMGVLQRLADFLKLFGKIGVIKSYYIGLGYRGLVYNLSLFMLCGYGFLLCGWGSNTKYSLFGAIRAAFSRVTFEGVLMCLVMLVGLLIGKYGVCIFRLEFGFIILGGALAYPIVLISILCGCQRSPFDFSESESDLVSGFKTDYYGLSFAIIFACEYAIMLEMLFFFIHTFFLIFVRAVFPRIRYDYFVSLM
ncbi:unnamed protein product [Protopolystoma xenopodis]|uniref:NADH-ubiquinone oxidoreductase chain 1 n=1 Tax=Protopolystoma xenopodis TaxID=117903 RepID=A0A448X0N8_9PLAT|nr:unnamed protein product [Protopolystoma xenopodis]